MNNQHTQSFFTTAAHLQAILESLDEVHTAASDHTLDTLNNRGQAELIATLREIAYIAAEAAAELEGQMPRPVLRLMEGPTRRESADGCKASRSTEPGGEKPHRSGGLRVLVTGETPLPFYVLKQAGG